VIAHYAGDGTFGASNSTSPITVTVNPEASSTNLSTQIFNFNNGATVAGSSAYYGDSIIIRADIVGASGQESSTGSVASAVTLFDAGKSLGSFPRNTEGYAEDQTASNVTGAFTPPLAVGSHSFTASFGGDSSYGSSSATTALAFTVLQAPTTTVVTPSLTTVAANAPISLSAFVDTQSINALSSGGSSGAAPTGSVTFFAGTTNLGSATVSTAPLDAAGFVAAQATLTNVKLTATSAITAVYSGDTNYTASPASPPVTVTVSSTGTFTVTPANGGVITASAPGQSATDAIAVNGTSFSGTITLTVSGVSPNNLSDTPACSFGTTGTITLNAGATPPAESGSGTLTCTTTAAGSVFIKPLDRPGNPSVFATLEVGAAVACIFLLAAAGQKRRGMVLLGMALIAVVVVGASCGSSSGGGGTNPGTTVGAYAVTVTATPAGGTAQQTTVTLNVN